MKFLVDKTVDLSNLIENQFPQFVREDSSTFIEFIKSYYQSQELKNQPLDIAENLIEYYNVSHFRKSELIENTTLSVNITETDTTITVADTTGFPEKGYIQIDSEIIYYASKTSTTFVNCVRGTSALVLESIPFSEVLLKSSVSDVHESGVSVVNIAYAYTSEFLRRIKTEIAVGIPETLVEELEISTFLTNVRTFYSSKGSLNSHRILFRILFNDKKIRFKIENRGSGATLKVINFDGAIGNAQVLSGGSGYDDRTNQNGDLLNPPIVEIFGSGNGINIANKTAVIKVTKIINGRIPIGSTIDSSYNGITITDAGLNYVGPITAFVREKDFGEEELVTTVSGNGSGIVESWDFNTNELTLTNIIGFFNNNDELVSSSGEQARGYVDYFEFVSQDPDIEFPKDYLLKPSSSNFVGKKIARLEVISGSLDEIENDKITPPSYLTLIQKQDTIFGLKNVSIESGSISKIDNIGYAGYEIDIDINDDFNNLYLPASTQLTHEYTVGDTKVTVNDATGFPVTNGIIYIDGFLVEYKERTANQFLDCITTQTSGSKIVNTEVVSYGRYKTRRQYSLSEYVKSGQQRYYGDNLYESKTTGKTSSVDYPTHKIGTRKVGSIEWNYIGDSKVDYFLTAFVGTPNVTATGEEGDLYIFVDSARKLSVGQSIIGSGIATDAKISSINGKKVTLSLPNVSKVSGGCIASIATVRVVGLVENINIEKSGSLFTEQIYELDDKNYKDFEGIEYSSWNINSNHILDADGDYIGVTSVYDNTENNNQGNVYVSSSGIPPYTSAKNRTLNNVFDGYTNAFLTNITAPIDIDSLFIFRNAVIQDSLSDFSIINDVLNFTTVPLPQEELYIRYFSTPGQVDRISVSQGSTTSEVVLSTTNSLSRDEIFVFLNGVLQVGNSFTWNDTTKVATFGSQIVDVTTDDIIVFSINGANVLDSITTSSSLTYTLQDGGSNFTSATTDSVIVAINGVVQRPNSSYTISGSTLTLTEVNSGVELTVIEVGSGVVLTTLSTLNGINLDRNNYKLQKLFKRIPYPSSIINDNIIRKSKSLTPVETKKALGITIDGIQYQSLKGNSTEYGAVESLTIGNGGNYFIPYTNSGSFDKSNYPQVILKKNGGEQSDIVITENIIEIAGSITKINFNLFEQSIISNLTGFTSKPKIEVINNNPSNSITSAEFRSAVLDVGFKNGNIDNILVLDPGFGYVESPTIRISGGGKFTTYDLPFVNSGNGEILVQMSGPIISSKSSSNTIILTNELGSQFTSNPLVSIDDGSEAVITVTVSNGKIVATQILNPGKNYHIEPELQITSTNLLGSGAVLRPVLSNGQIIDVIIINPGTGYIIPPTIIAKNISVNSVVSSQLKKWTFNIANRFITGVDIFGGYVFDEQFGDNYTVESFTPDSLVIKETFTVNDIVVGMEVTHPRIPVGTFVSRVDVATRTVNLSKSGLNVNTDFLLIGDKVSILQGDNRIRGSLKVAEVLPTTFPESRLKYQYLQLTNTKNFENHYGIVSTEHSKIVGWSYDGHPIYCKYGYTNALDKTSGISEQTSSYRLKGLRTNGPSLVDYPMGSFIEDYEYIEGLGTLDQYNGRFSVTPEFPNGAYCYFMVSEYPFVIGPTYFSDPDCYNLGQNRTNDKIPSILTLVNDPNNDQFPEQIKNVNKTLLKTSVLRGGSVDSIYVENKGSNYKTGDYLVFDNSETSGSGVVAYVSSVESPPVISSTVDNDKKEITFNFSGPHNVSENDVIYIDIKKASSNTIINLDLLTTPISTLNNKPIYSLVLDKSKLYRLEFGSARKYNLSFDSLNFNPYHQENIVLGSDHFIIDPEKIPSKLFVHTNTLIIELSVVTSPLVSRYVVKSSTTNSFVLPLNEKITSVPINSLDFGIRSRGATGPIKTINIVNGGSGYKKLPAVVGVDSETGSGAILSASSETIGSIKRISYVSYGDQFYGSRNAKNYVKLPITVKVKSNFTIKNIKVKDAGQNYFLNPYYRINGQSNLADLSFRYSIGEVVEVNVNDGGSGFSSTPTLELFSQNGGSGATFDIEIERRSLIVGDTVSSGSSTAKILNIDIASSTIELLVTSGAFKVNDVLLSSDNRQYGTIVEVNTARAYAKSSPYGNISEKFIGTVGFISDDYQKIEDNLYYQDWSYSIVNQRNTKEWGKEVLENTHPSGFRLFGKQRLHSRKSLLGRSQNIVRSAVTFKASISSLLNASVKTPPCKKQIIWIDTSPNPYVLYDIIYGNQSEALGLVIEVGENYIIVDLYDKEVEINEFIINVLRVLPISTTSSTDKLLLNVNGILQEPFTSYTVSGSNIEPSFPPFPLDEITSYSLTTPFTDITSSGVNSGNRINLTVDGNPYSVSDRNKLLVSLNGVIQRNTNLTIVGTNNNIIEFGTSIQDTPNFVLYHPQLTPLSFTGSAGTTFDLGFTPADDCQLLIFFVGVNQSHLLTDYSISGSTITFPSSVDQSEIFGWYIDETVVCEKISVSGVYDQQVKGKKLICNAEKNVTLKIFSDNVKKPNGFFELEKENLDGTLYVDGNKAYGFGSRFKYSNPEYSTSYVEVINDISGQFNGSTTTFDLTINAVDPYIPNDGEDSLMVTLDGVIIQKSQYSITGSQINFVTAPANGVECSIRDFVGAYQANYSTRLGAELDQFNIFNGSRTRFNLSDNGVPETINNNTDVFTVKNNVLLRPDVHLNAIDSRTNVQLQIVSQNKIDYTVPPITTDVYKLMSFNRQLVPENHRNWVLDRNEHFDGVRTTFTLLHSFDADCDDLVGEDPRVESLIVIRNGVYQYPTTDYTLIDPVDPNDINSGSGSYRIQFVDPPRSTEDVFILFTEDTANFQDRTDELTQTSSTVLSYTTAIANPSTMVPFVYVDGVYQDQNSYVWDGAANTLTFVGTNLPTLATDQVEFHAKLGTLRPQNVYTDILNAWLVVLQRNNHNEVLVPTVNNTFTVTQRSGSTTISGTDVVNIVQRSGTLTIGSNHYRITNLDLNAFVMHDDPANTFVAFDGVVQEPGVAYDHSGAGSAIPSSTLGNGLTYDNMSIPMGVGYLAAIDIVEFDDELNRQYSTDEINQVYDGSRTRFRLQLDGIKYTNYTAHEDIIVSKNNVLLHPGVDYTVTNPTGVLSDPTKGCIDFTVAPVANDDIWMVGMHDNELITLTPVTTQIYNTSRALSAAEQESIIFVQNDHTKYGLARGAEFTSTTQMNFDTATTTGTPFAILTTTGKVLDRIHTPYDNSRTEFNLFLDEENFIPSGSFANDSIIDPRNLYVTKNGIILTPIIDYNLTGTIDSRIIFTTPPAPSDNIFIETHGLIKQLDSVVGNGSTTYNLTDSSSTYYPDALIGRPRELENQIIAVRNGLILDPLKDYYVYNDKIVFTSSQTASDTIRLYDHMSLASDIEVESYSQQVDVGEYIQIPGESERRQVTAVHSPTVMEVTTPAGLVSPSGLSATPTISNGNLTGVTVTSGGRGYPRRMKFRTYGIGNSASANSYIDPIKGGEIKTNVVVDYEGHNLANTTLVPTYETYVVRDVVLSSSNVCFGTKLSSNISDSDTTIPVYGTSMAFASNITITITSTGGAGAILQPFVVNGRLVNVDIENGGSGYNDLDIVLTVNDGGGSGAVLEPTLDANGTITNIEITNEGIGYDSFRAFINNEVIEYTTHNSTELKGVSRGIASTSPAAASSDDRVLFADCEQP